jgi:hypothetical protein
MIPITTVIASGFVISGDVDLRKRILVGIFTPVIDSAALGFRASFDQTSANFVRLTEPRGFPGSLELRIPVGGGSLMALYPQDQGIYTPAWLRIETLMPSGSLQVDNRSFQLWTLPRGASGM